MEVTGLNVTKKCKVCKKQKDASEFYRNGTWLRPECKECYLYNQSLYVRLRKKQTPPDPGTPCECCGIVGATLCWDHDHKTGKHRGWICSNCNTGIGKLGDNVEGVQKAVDYLEEANSLDDSKKGDDDLATS